MPIIRKVLQHGNSKAVSIPKSWLEWIERQSGETVKELLIEVDGSLVIQPILSKTGDSEKK